MKAMPVFGSWYVLFAFYASVLRNSLTFIALFYNQTADGISFLSEIAQLTVI